MRERSPIDDLIEQLTLTEEEEHYLEVARRRLLIYRCFFKQKSRKPSLISLLVDKKRAELKRLAA